MLKIDVIRFDVQDVIATSAPIAPDNNSAAPASCNCLQECEKYKSHIASCDCTAAVHSWE